MNRKYLPRCAGQLVALDPTPMRLDARGTQIGKTSYNVWRVTKATSAAVSVENISTGFVNELRAELVHHHDARSEDALGVDGVLALNCQVFLQSPLMTLSRQRWRPV